MYYIGHSSVSFLETSDIPEPKLNMQLINDGRRQLARHRAKSIEFLQTGVEELLPSLTDLH